MVDVKKMEAILQERFESCNVSVEKQGDEVCAEINFSSDAGEDFYATIFFDGTWGNFVEKFREYAYTFDADEHAEVYVNLRGENGIPSSIRELIDDADMIANTLEELADGLEIDEYTDEWEEKTLFESRLSVCQENSAYKATLLYSGECFEGEYPNARENSYPCLRVTLFNKDNDMIFSHISTIPAKITRKEANDYLDDIVKMLPEESTEKVVLALEKGIKAIGYAF